MTNRRMFSAISAPPGQPWIKAVFMPVKTFAAVAFLLFRPFAAQKNAGCRQTGVVIAERLSA